uniref:ATP synthase complex subunit 8 n=1 Tax=Curculionoidea sp. 27 KM-2017 TaxID=2219411 RepID=A0A346RKP1_9CUCU|nr:ATP synthase F0 subunit 8 [Curculionoidea sp. 27 KM-2017]
MPQMSPLNWLLLYYLFITLFILTIILNYYMFLYTPKTIKTKKLNQQINWKW